MSQKTYFDFGELRFGRSALFDAQQVYRDLLDRAVVKALRVGASFFVPTYRYPDYAVQPMECPLCFRNMTVEIRSEAADAHSSFVHIRTLSEVQFYCAAGCGFLAVYTPQVFGKPNRDEMRLVTCPDEPEPGRLAAMENWARNTVLVGGRSRP